jgi:hypothetical protein
MAFAGPSEQDVPLTPFHRTYFNFGNGQVDYGFQEPGQDSQSDEIIRAYHAVLPEGQLAGSKKDFMPVFSGVNQEAIEQRPILQSLGKLQNTLWLGGVTELADEMKIDPRQSLMSGSNIPGNMIESAGQLATALDTMGYHHNTNGLNTANPYGQRLPFSKTLAGGEVAMSPEFYSSMTYMSEEPLVSSDGYQYTDATLMNQ